MRFVDVLSLIVLALFRGVMHFYYLTGQTILAGDIVLAGGKLAVVDKVVNPSTSESRDFSCDDTGGTLLAFQDGDLQLWPFINEDLEFIEREAKQGG